MTPSNRNGWTRAVLLASVLWTIPLWTVRFLPMVDYPQQLALSAILRWYGDASRGFRDTYELIFTTPHSLFKLVTAGLAWILPIETAGKLVVALSLAAVGPAALALCRRSGRPGWYAFVALALTYNYAFFWGFVDNLIAYPLALFGIALADRCFEREWRASSWSLLAGITLLFYAVHLQFLLLFAGAVGWLAIVRLPGWRRLAVWLSPLLPGLVLGGWVLSHASLQAPEGVVSAYEQRMRTLPAVHFGPGLKLARLPRDLFGHTDGTEWMLAAIAGVLLGSVLATAGRAPRDEGEDPAWRGRLFRSRFTTLAGWVGLLYLITPESRGGFLIAERLAPMAALLAVVALPPPAPARRRIAAVLAAGFCLLQLGQTAVGFLRFEREMAGLGGLLAETEPGQSLGALIYDPVLPVWNSFPLLLHVPAYYQVEKGGRILFSFAELYQTPVRFRPGKSWDDLLVEWNEWHPERFSYPRHGGRFRYFLVHGGPEHLEAAFGPYLGGMKVRSAGRWQLVERVW